MRIAFTHNLRLTDSEEEAEFDTAETVDAIAEGLRAGGHEVEKIEVTGPASRLAARIESYGPDLIFNTAEGRRGRTREAFYPALFEELGFPYTCSDAYVLTVTLDKWMTKLVLAQRGIDTPRGRLITPDELKRLKAPGTLGLALPVIVKPNYEGSSKGIGDDAVVRDAGALADILPRALRAYPNGVLVEEFVAGSDVTVPFLEGRGDEGVLLPVDYLVEPSAKSRFNLYDYRLKSADSSKVSVRCPPEQPRDVISRLQALSKMAARALGIRDLGRVDFRLGEDGRIYLLEVNALPSLERGSGLYAAAARVGLNHDEVLQSIVESAARRQGLVVKPSPRKRRAADPLRLGFTYNVKRVDTKAGNDTEAEYDAPETIVAIREALESYGHQVVLFEATAELPRLLMQTPVDLVFNIAEGVEGRNREAAVPALCELLGIPYTGSDAATLSIALDKALSKRVLLQHEILTAEFQLMETGRERLSPKLKFPLIVKPNQEGSSKGVSASASVVDDEEALRAVVRELIERYRQPALVEVYIPGREFTVGLLGDRRPRVLPPMEILFKDKGNARPVYDFQIKQEWEKHVSYQCPAQLSPAEMKALERVCRETFAALDCRDVARVDLRMTPKGEFYVIEVNPLPGLTPGYSDLCLIATAAGIDYRTLIGEILEGGLKRLREKRREARSAGAGGGEWGYCCRRCGGEHLNEREREHEHVNVLGGECGDRGGGDERRVGMRARLRELGFSIGRFPVGKYNAITDVGGVRVGHTTLIQGEGPLEVGKGPVRTGVTAIVPHPSVFDSRVVAGGFVLNGAGELSGVTQVQEWGLLETPIFLTNTMAVGKVSDAAVKWMTKKWPTIGGEDDVVIPLVGECDDSWLNDAVGRHVRSEHVYRAIEQAAGGRIAEGAVGAGTGLITCDFKAGIGTSSRCVEIEGHDYTVGVLVQSNFGVMRNLRVDGAPVGEVLEPLYQEPRREKNAGSIITVIATDAPLLSPQLVRICKRAALGIGRCGSFAAHGSGEIIVAFSTANKVPRETSRMTATLDVLLDEACDPLYEATVEGTEEAIINSLCMADEMRGQSGHVARALPLDRLQEILRRYKQAFSPAPPQP